MPSPTPHRQLEKNEYLFPFLCPLSCSELQREAGKKSRETELIIVSLREREHCHTYSGNVISPLPLLKESNQITTENLITVFDVGMRLQILQIKSAGGMSLWPKGGGQQSSCETRLF